ncbi:hypothetical protein GCM10022200_08360 [Microbacterium awajiense]|uniref:KANL3/Tex30 alpha/beta hydrolase-like domain-containing protein n=1 Tax=Microbacterium awajiense TaxID=415214 RepID=A0ABP7AAJ4_9MICO
MSAEALRLPVALPSGSVEVSADWEPAPTPRAVMAIAPGAGAGHRQPFLVGFADALRVAGVSTLRFTFPYQEAGRRMPGPAAHAVATWAAAADALALRAPGLPPFAAGKSYGGRMASMAAADSAITPAGLVYLGYPLHPPGRPDKPRVEHLPKISAPQLFVSGTRDPFVDPHEQLTAAVDGCVDAELRWVEGGGHSFEVAGRRRPAAQIAADLVPTIVEWVLAQARAADEF